MTVREVLELYDNWKVPIRINGHSYGSGLDVYHNPKVNRLKIKSFLFLGDTLNINVEGFTNDEYEI